MPTAQTKTAAAVEPLYDLEGLKNDFPTASDLEKFVYDETGVSLSLRGRSNDFKYSVALKVLNNAPLDEDIKVALGNDNPYVDKNDLIPEDAIRTLPARDPKLPPENTRISIAHFDAPHPDPAERAGDRKVTIEYKKYENGVITYKIVGPMEQRARGTRLDKYGRTRPEAIGWDDPRTEERIMRQASGEFTREGAGMQAMLQRRGLWHFVDRQLADQQQQLIENPWG